MAARLMPHRIALCLTATAAYKRVLIIFYIRDQKARISNSNRHRGRATPSLQLRAVGGQNVDSVGFTKEVAQHIIPVGIDLLNVELRERLAEPLHRHARVVFDVKLRVKPCARYQEPVNTLVKRCARQADAVAQVDVHVAALNRHRQLDKVERVGRIVEAQKAQIGHLGRVAAHHHSFVVAEHHRVKRPVVDIVEHRPGILLARRHYRHRAFGLVGCSAAAGRKCGHKKQRHNKIDCLHRQY